MAQFAVIGMSSFGYYLARQLSELGCKVLVIDRQQSMVDKIKAYVSKAVVADASDRDTLRELGVPEMDAVILSLGKTLDAPILAAMNLKKLGAKKELYLALPR